MLAFQLKRLAFSAAFIASSVTLSGCYYISPDDISTGLASGVPLADLDTAGSAPDSIALVGPDVIVLTEGAELDIEVEGDPDVLEKLRFDLDGRDLVIGREDGWSSKGSATIRVTMPAPSEVTVAGSGTIKAATIASNAEIDIAGSGMIDVETIDARSLEVNIGGSGVATGAGTADDLEVSVAGSGDVRMEQLIADNVEVSIAGSGDVEVSSNGEVEASIAGSGDVKVFGDAKCTVSSMGSGTLTCASAKTAASARKDGSTSTTVVVVD